MERKCLGAPIVSAVRLLSLEAQRLSVNALLLIPVYTPGTLSKWLIPTLNLTKAIISEPDSPEETTAEALWVFLVQ